MCYGDANKVGWLFDHKVFALVDYSEWDKQHVIYEQMPYVWRVLGNKIVSTVYQAPGSEEVLCLFF